MKIPPKKPHFLKPILPGFRHQLKIPKGFLKYLKGHDHIEHATLKMTGKKWMVKLNGRRLEDGWEKFAEELNLQLGDLLIFRHEGDMKFEVSIFDSSQFEREYGAEEKACTPEENSKNFKFKEKPSPNIESSVKASYHMEVATHKPFGHSRFVCIIKPYSFTYGFLVSLKTQLSWNLRIRSCETQVTIGDGCRKFIDDNCLKEGDCIMFEVVANGETPIWKFHVVTYAETPMRKFQAITSRRTSDVTAPKLQVAVSTSADANPHFISTIKSYSIRISTLYLPLAFAKSTGLMNGHCEMILIDEKHRSWSMWLGKMGCLFGIRRGWTKFIKANGLRVGDTYKFELINNGKIPIAYILCKYSGKDV
ncbi:unnamed protein product [Withania somnifera]